MLFNIINNNTLLVENVPFSCNFKHFAFDFTVKMRGART